MKIKKTLAAAVATLTLAAGIGGTVPVSASEWSWANYGFSGTAIANPDPFEKTAYLIGGYVASVNHLNPTPTSYVYDADIVPDTEGVAIRFRFSWANTEPGYKAVADLADGIAVYPMDESLDVAVVTEGGVQRYSFPVPAAYDYLSANHFTVKDNSSEMMIEVCGKVVAILQFDGTRTVSGKTCYTNITVTDGNGYVYGRISDSLVLAEGCYVGYSSQQDRALILVKRHTLEEMTFDVSLPEEKETTEDWVPETDSPVTEAPEPLPETSLETETLPESTTEIETSPETEAETELGADTASVTEPIADSSEAEGSGGGCSGATGAVAVLLAGGSAAVILGKKKHEEADHEN